MATELNSITPMQDPSLRAPWWEIPPLFPSQRDPNCAPPWIHPLSYLPAFPTRAPPFPIPPGMCGCGGISGAAPALRDTVEGTASGWEGVRSIPGIPPCALGMPWWDALGALVVCSLPTQCSAAIPLLFPLSHRILWDPTSPHPARSALPSSLFPGGVSSAPPITKAPGRAGALWEGGVIPACFRHPGMHTQHQFHHPQPRDAAPSIRMWTQPGQRQEPPDDPSSRPHMGRAFPGAAPWGGSSPHPDVTASTREVGVGSGSPRARPLWRRWGGQGQEELLGGIQGNSS